MPPILESKRLRLRNLTENDNENIYQLSKNPNVMRYIRNGEVLTREQANADLNRRLRDNAQYEKQGMGFWIIEWKDSGGFIGWMALKLLDQTNEYEIGYRILEEYWGQGITSEASRRVLRYAFEELGLERVVAVALPENTASWKVMEKIGMRHEKNGHFYDSDCVYYSIEKTEWLNLQ